MIRKKPLYLLFLTLLTQLATATMLGTEPPAQLAQLNDARFLKQWIVKKAKNEPTSLQENNRAFNIGKKIGIAAAIAVTVIVGTIVIGSRISKKTSDNQNPPNSSDPLIAQLETLDKQNQLTIEKLKEIIIANPDLIKLVDQDGETFMLGFLRVSDESQENKLELFKFAVKQGLDLSIAPYLELAQKKGYEKIANYLKEKEPQ